MEKSSISMPDSPLKVAVLSALTTVPSPNTVAICSAVKLNGAQKLFHHRTDDKFIVAITHHTGGGSKDDGEVLAGPFRIVFFLTSQQENRQSENPYSNRSQPKSGNDMKTLMASYRKRPSGLFCCSTLGACFRIPPEYQPVTL